MTEEQVLFVGGPFDGTTQTRRVGEEMIYLLVKAADEEPAIHRYGQADTFNTAEESFAPGGERRYLYMGRLSPE